MALSQLQCLDDNHVNLRTHESKPEFLYCEDQRLALEALLRDGREAFFKYLEARGLRGFLSDPELETLTGTVQPYDPGTEVFPETAEEDEPPLSLHYWPDLSDTSIPQMDLGWPDSDAYRGVTRTTVFSQPPLDGQAHIKEIVRKMIAQAQKVIAVVMDVFTDVDIFRDLLDAGFKRKVSVYILLERTTLPHFLSMCQRANMHAGHLKHLRVRYTGGVDFYTRSSTKVRGRMGHRFMFIDGDKAVSGSYSFTWMSSRLDRNFITVVTGQAVDAFDRLIRTLYMTSRLVDLRQVTTEPEPELEPLPQPVVVAPLFADLARKLYNPKYALALGNPSSNPSPTPTTSHNSPKKTESQENAEVPDTKTMKRRRAGKEAIQEEPPIHPGLTNLEKICLMSYLPTWPEPDPASDVIGFINIRDASKPTQVHLQRSEMFETSQAIRFSSPISMPKETLPEVAKPRQVAAKHEEMNKLRPAQNKTKVSVVDRAQPTQPNTRPADIQSKAEGPEQNSPASEPKCESYKDTLTIDNRLHSNPHLNAGHNPTPCLNTHALPHSSNKASTPYTGRPSHMNQTVTNNSPELNSLPRSNTKEEEETSSNTQNAHTSHLSGPTESNTRQQIKTVLPRTDSHTEPQNSSEINHNIQIPTVKSNLFPSSTSATCSQSVSPPSFSGNNHVSITTSMTTTAPLSSINPPLTSSSTVSPPIPSSSPSSSFTPTPPIPKPRTIQLVIKDGFTSDGQKLTEFSVIRRHQPSTGPQVAHNEPAVATEVKTKMPEKEPETVPELQSNNGKCKKGAQKDADNRGNIREDPQQKQSETSQEAKNEEVIGPTDDRARMDLLAGTNLDALPDFLNTDAPEAGSVNSQKITPKDVDPKILSIDCKVAPLIADVATVQAGTDATERVQTVCEFAEAPNEKNVTQRKTYLPSQLQRPSCCAMTAKGMDVLDTVECLNAPTHIPVTATHKARMSEDIVGLSTHTSTADTRGQQSDPCCTPTYCRDSWPNTAKHNTHTTFQELIPNERVSTHTPETPLCLHFFDTHMPDIRSPTPERELQSLSALVCTPSPDVFLPRLPTPDSQIHSPEPRSHTTGFRTPTSDVSDGYVSPRTDSTLSTTSEEYYECSDTPVLDTVLYQAVYRSHGKTEDHVSFTHSNIPNAATIVTSPAYINYNTCAATIIASDRNTSSSESQSFPRPASVSSSLHERKVKMGEEEKTENEENGRDVDEKGKEPSVAEMGGEQDLRGPQRRGSEEAERTADHLKQGKHLTNSVDKNKETQPQAPKRKRVLNQSAAERLVDGRVTPEELTSEEAEAKQVSTGDLKPAEAPSEGERLDKEKAVDKADLGPSGLERRGRRLSSTETEGQKPPPKPLQGNQQDGASSPSRPSRPSRPLSGPRPCGSRQLNKAASKVHHGSFQVLDKASSPCGLPTRPPPAVAAGAAGSAAGRKQAEASNSQQSLPPRQPLAAQGRMKTGQSTNQHPHPKPQASFLHTHSKMLPQLHPHSKNQTVSAQEAQCQEEGKTPVSFPFSKLYGLKTLKDKMSKLPGQSKRDGTSSPVQGHKKTS